MKNEKNDIIGIRYNTNLDRLQIGKRGIIRRLYNTIRNHKIISMAVISLVIFSTANVVMIYQFMKILQNI